MIEKLKGFVSLEKIKNDIYKFSFHNKRPIYVMWSDEGERTENLLNDSNDLCSAYIKKTFIYTDFDPNKDSPISPDPNIDIVPSNKIDINSTPIFVEEIDKENDGVMKCEGDCDPNDPNTFLGADEICDGRDNDCDEEVDEDLVQECFTEGGTGTETCENGQWVCTAPPPYEECIFIAEIKAIGQGGDGSTVKIGIDPNGKSYPYPTSPPPDYTVVLKIAGGANGFIEDIRMPGIEKEKWELNVSVTSSQFNGATDPNKPGFFPELSWDPNAFCPPDPNIGYFRLYSEDSQGKRMLLVPDITQTSQYQTKEADGQCFGNIMCTFTYYIVWSRDIEFEMNLLEGWSMISLPLEPPDAKLSTVFPGSAVMYRVERGSGYVRVQPNEQLKIGTGYWILVNEDQNYVLSGQPIQSYSKPVYGDGWEMIGGCTFGAKPTTDSCGIGVIYRFVSGSGYVRVHHGSELMEPGRGFWILLKEVADQCQLTVETSGVL